MWREADITERHRLLLTGVYVDARKLHSIVMIRPEAVFRAVFETDVTREWSGVALINMRHRKISMGLIPIRVHGGDGRESNYTVNAT